MWNKDFTIKKLCTKYYTGFCMTLKQQLQLFVNIYNFQNGKNVNKASEKFVS